MRNMSFSLTTAQVLAQTKDVTRRMGWLKLKAGDLVQPVKKCMGLKPGEKIEKLGSPIRIVSVRREQLDCMTLDYGFSEVEREGFAGHPAFCWPSEWIKMFCSTHKGCAPDTVITRIEFAYTQI
jgi:hypothetical protein